MYVKLNLLFTLCLSSNASLVVCFCIFSQCLLLLFLCKWTLHILCIFTIQTSYLSGVTKHVGDAISERTTRTKSKVVAVGVAPWGMIERTDLIGHDVG